jgi:PEP-CTERM motif-containing protein
MCKYIIAIFAAVAGLSVASPVKADIINVTVAGPGVGTGTGANFNSQPLGAVAPSFSIGDWTFTAGSGALIDVLSDGTGAQPLGTTGRYLSITGAGGLGTENVTFSARSSVSFFWGSIDAYNTIKFSDGTTFTGSDIASLFTGGQADGCQTLTACNRYFTFTDMTGANLTGFTLSSSSNSFEITNISAVPEASTWAMMLLGFLGLGFLGYRKSSRSSNPAFRVA